MLTAIRFSSLSVFAWNNPDECGNSFAQVKWKILISPPTNVCVSQLASLSPHLVDFWHIQVFRSACDQFEREWIFREQSHGSLTLSTADGLANVVTTKFVYIWRAYKLEWVVIKAAILKLFGRLDALNLHYDPILWRSWTLIKIERFSATVRRKRETHKANGGLDIDTGSYFINSVCIKNPFNFFARWSSWFFKK